MNRTCPEFPPNSQFIKDDMIAPGPTGNGDKMVFVVGDDDLYLRIDLEEPGMYRKLVAYAMRGEWMDAQRGPIGRNLTLLKWHRYCDDKAQEWYRWGENSRLTLKEAQDRGVCRFCEKPFGRSAYGAPHDWKFQFGEMLFPERIILNFGKEFAHAACLEQAKKS